MKLDGVKVTLNLVLGLILQCKAEDKGDHYLVNGTKIWTTMAQHADMIFCLVRTSKTDKPQAGISFLLIDMKTEGIDVRPLITLDQSPEPYQEVNQVFFEDVKVPKENLVGEENKGWTYAKYLLEFERGNTYSPSLYRGGNDVVTLAKKHFGEEDGKIANGIFRADVTSHKMKEHAFGLTLKRAGDEGGKASAVASMFKYYGTEHNKKTS